MPRPPEWWAWEALKFVPWPHLERIRSLNAITLLIDNPCNEPWLVYWETALPALGEAWMVLLIFGGDDIIRGYLRPKGLYKRKPRHSIVIGGILGKLIPEIGEALGKRLPHAEKVKARKVTHGVKNLWIIDGVLQRILFWFMILDVLSDFLIAWESAINETRFCQKINVPRLYATGTGGAVAAIQGWQAVGVPDVQYAQGGITWLLSTFIVPPGNFNAICAIRGKKLTWTPGEYEIGLFRTADPFNPIDVSGPVTIGVGEEGEAIMAGRVEGPGSFGFQHRITNGGFLGTQGDVFIQAA